MTQLHSRLCGCGGPHDVHFACHLPRPCLVCPVNLACRCRCLCDLFLAGSRPGRHVCPVRKVFFAVFGFVTMFTFLLFSNSSFAGVSVMVDDFLFIRFVAVAFRGIAFWCDHKSSRACLSDDPLWVDAAGDP